MRAFVICLIAVFLLILPTIAPATGAPPPVKRPYEIIEATIEGGDPRTVDPAFCYDTISGELLLNCYDTLVFYDGERLDRPLPQLATEWTIQNITGETSSEGLAWYFRYTFAIRQHVPFHDLSYGNVAAEDVEYCFERGMVLDMDGGPQWMFYEPLLNGAAAEYINGRVYDPEGNVTERELVGRMIDHAIESNVTHVWFNLAFPGGYTPFMHVLSQVWSSIYSKAWALNLGRPTTIWTGVWGDYTDWWAYHNPSLPSGRAPLDDPTPVVMGTGPFVFANLNRNLMYWDVNRFADYWRDWPLDWPVSGGSRPAGYINHFAVTWAYDWTTRQAKFLNGDVDYCAVPRQYVNSTMGQSGIRCIYPLPSLSVDAFFFNFNINATSPYGPIFSPGILNESGIPSDFLGNPSWGVHVRKAFAYSIDYDYYINTMFLGEAMHPTTAIIPILPYYDPMIQGYVHNTTAAAEELRQVPGLWDRGFTIQLVYNMGSLPRQGVQNSIKASVEGLNPKFHVVVKGVSWSEYLIARSQSMLSAFPLGWLADYPDPDNLAYPFYHSSGELSRYNDYDNSAMDALIEAGVAEPDGQRRATIYHDIQQLAIDDCPSATIDSALGRHFERDWIVGWYYNAAYSGQYVANTWKGYYVPHALSDTSTQPTSNCLPYDVNHDGKANMMDIARVAASFGTFYGPPISTRWNFTCDLSNDRGIDMRDIGRVASAFGKTSQPWNPPP